MQGVEVDDVVIFEALILKTGDKRLVLQRHQRETVAIVLQRLKLSAE